MTGFFIRLWKDERGEVAIEYGLLVAVVALGLVAVLSLLSSEVQELYSRIIGRPLRCATMPPKSNPSFCR